MNTLRIVEWDQPTQFEDIAQPQPASDEVLVRVHAAAVNPIDVFTALGYLRQYMSAPVTLGKDFAGEVVSVGDDVDHVKPGDAVYGLGSGTFAEYAVVKGAGLAPKPDTLTYDEAAAVPLVALSAWQALFTTGQLQPGETVLIHGAGGAIGNAAVQLAKSHGATVIAHARANKKDFLLELGADEFIDADSQVFEELVSDVDLIVDTIGGEFIERSLGVLREGGRFVTLAGSVPEGVDGAGGVAASSILTQGNVDDLNSLATVIDAGDLEVFVNRTFPFDEAQTALFYKAEGGTPGKIVISLN